MRKRKQTRAQRANLLDAELEADGSFSCYAAGVFISNMAQIMNGRSPPVHAQPWLMAPGREPSRWGGFSKQH